MRSEEPNDKLPLVMRHSVDLLGNHAREKNLCGPPPVRPQLDPHDIVIQREPSRFALLANVAPLGRGEFQTLYVEARRAGFATDERASHGADEAPGGVHVVH